MLWHNKDIVQISWLGGSSSSVHVTRGRAGLALPSSMDHGTGIWAHYYWRNCAACCKKICFQKCSWLLFNVILKVPCDLWHICSSEQDTRWRDREDSYQVRRDMEKVISSLYFWKVHTCFTHTDSPLSGLFIHKVDNTTFVLLLFTQHLH